MKKLSSKRTQSVHVGSVGDPQWGGVVNPIYPSAAYDYSAEVRYPRYFNTPNHVSVAEKMAALENGEAGMVFSSGMAAIMTAMMAMVKAGDHIVFQNELYGGTYHAVLNELERYGIGYTLVEAADPKNFQRAIQPNTKLIYIETPSNPLLRITDVRAVARIARQHKIVSMIDNTFASPINQNPIALGIDIVAHSGTKYIGGHSDLCCGVVVTSHALMEKVRASALHFGGSLDAFTCWLVERSLKTIVLRVQQQNENAMTLARALSNESKISAVYYPGLKTHPGHAIAKKQMSGFGGMMSFDIKGDTGKFLKRLKIIKKAISLGGVESTMTEPVKTSHAKMTEAERKRQGIKPTLIRFSVGIEDAADLLADIRQAL